MRKKRRTPQTPDAENKTGEVMKTVTDQGEMSHFHICTQHPLWVVTHTDGNAPTVIDACSLSLAHLLSTDIRSRDTLFDLILVFKSTKLVSAAIFQGI